ncbi:YlxQ-related RNA-binding protein [Enterococcus mediterraneensis]|uniref:YlxQ-related RNA-binding protein n=1 Tax=Enterococcus mediterraneensis TaxID=2364791 RepID=UPI000F062C95|nr:YlxQ-related RNA-binding protein [Enterococcus mediterraneensis]
MNKTKVLNMLGLAMRAGKLVTGEELVIKEIRGQKAAIVLIAHDAGKNTQKKIKDKSTYYKIPCFDGLTADELSQAIGKPRMVIAVMDQGFGKRIEELIQG